MRTFYNHTCPNCARLAFSEGWANFYSLAAQEQQGVRRVDAIGAGDGVLLAVPNPEPPPRHLVPGYDPQTHTGPHLGEDQQIAVMRLLWDLRDEYGMNTLYQLLRDNQVKTASALWNLLSAEIPTGPDFMAEMAALADIFVAAGMGTTGLQASIGQAAPASHVTWNSGDPEPTFRWRIPFSCQGLALQLLDRFAILFFDSEGNPIETISVSFPPGTIFTNNANLATYQIAPNEWSAIRNGRAEVFWTILSGADFGSFQSGWYWSNDVGNTRITISP